MIRLSWLASCLTVCLAGAATPAADILLVRQTVSPPAPGLTQGTVDGFLSRLSRRLQSAGVETATRDDRDITAEALAGCRLLVFPYNPAVPEAVLSAAEAFVGQGGKVGLFYCSETRLLNLVGVSASRYAGSAELPKLEAVLFRPGRLRQAPDQLRQRSWNIAVPTPAPSAGTTIAATWAGPEGADTGLAAMTLHPAGFTFGHVYLDEDRNAGEEWLLALFEHYAPGTWATAVQRHLEAPLDAGDCPDLEALARRARESRRPEALAESLRATELRHQAQALVQAGQLAQARALTTRFRESAEKAYLLSQRSRPGELRGAWIHSAYGIGDWGWDRTVQALAEAGFNAIFPNMCWGAVADYPSEVLPVHPDVAVKGDQLAQCLEACRKYGVELHVWRVNWNMGHRTPEAIRKQMIAAGRVQVTAKGEPSTFLAPHLEANQTLEREAMLEIVRKYPVDGIHFDYIRYPGEQSDFSDSALEAFSQWHGAVPTSWPADCRPGGALRQAYNAWRRSNINRLVQAVGTEAHRLRPTVRVSAAVFGAWEGTRESIAQDPVAWIRQGWIDAICPMNYTPSNDYLERLMEMQTDLTEARLPIYCGIGSYQHASPGRTAAQIDQARRLGADGFICFAHTENFAKRFLPGLALGSTREPAGTVLPHHPRQRLTFTASAPDPDLEDHYPLRRRLTVTARLPDQPWEFEPEVTLLRDGYPFIAGNAFDVERRPDGIDCELRPREPGRYQIEIAGRVRTGRRDSAEPLLSRSPVLRVLAEDEAAEALRRTGPPIFAGRRGARVGVWMQKGFGAESIFQALKDQPGLDVAPLYNLKPDSLAACHVVIMPQPRTGLRHLQSEAAWEPLRQYVRRGGSLMVTHALVGLRGFPTPFPEVAAGAAASEVTEWRVRNRMAATRAVPNGLHPSTFTDCITLTPGNAGTVLLETAEGRPVAVQGQVGRGRAIACGLGLGIGKGDVDVAVSEAEGRFLVSAVEWLAGRHRRR